MGAHSYFLHGWKVRYNINLLLTACSPFSLHKTNSRSAARSRTGVTGEVSRRHSLLRNVVPSSGRASTSFRGGKICARSHLRSKRWERAQPSSTVRIGDRFSSWLLALCANRVNLRHRTTQCRTKPDVTMLATGFENLHLLIFELDMTGKLRPYSGIWKSGKKVPYQTDQNGALICRLWLHIKNNKYY